MRWRRLGLVFDPRQHTLPGNCREFAQSPQVLPFDDFLRIYFSTREYDEKSGKYLSHVAFVDMTVGLEEVIQVSDHRVIALGELGTFDEHGIFPINVLRCNDLVYGYTCGWSRRVSVSVETAIGLVVSHDNGQTFERVGRGPIMTASQHEPCLVGDAFVCRVDDAFRMWYIHGTGWKRYGAGGTPERIYKIATAVSADGRNWLREERGQLISDRLGADECQALPTVVRVDGRYHMYFCYRYASDFRTNRARGYRIGHAWSANLMEWNRDDDILGLEGRAGDWDDAMQCYPHVFCRNDRTFLLYNGNEFGRYGFGAAVLEG